MEVKNVFVVGAGGLMGNGIVQVFIEAGFNVIANDIKEEFGRNLTLFFSQELPPLL